MTERKTQRVQKAAGIALILLLFLTPFSKAAVELLFPVLFITWLFGWKRVSAGNIRLISPPAQRVLTLLLLYLLVCLASIAYSRFPELSLRGFIAKTLEYALFFVIAADIADQPGIPQKSVRALLAAGWVIVLYGLLQEWRIFTAVYKPQATDPFRGRALDYIRMVGPYENPNDLATFFMVASLIAVGWIREIWTHPKRFRLAYISFCALLIGCLIWTRSFGAILGLFGGFGFLAFVYRTRKWLVLGLFGVTVVVLLIFVFLSPESLLQLLTFSDTASHDRISMWKTGWSMFLARPIWGQGLNTFMANYAAYSSDPTHNPAYAHNCFLQIAAETGIVGLSFFLLFLVSLSRLTWRVLRIPQDHPTSPETGPLRNTLLAFSAACLAFLIQSTFDTNLYALRQAALFWTLAGMVLGISTRLLRLRSKE